MKRVMFVCKKNSARSQMAEGFATILGRDNIEVTSSGLEASQVRPEAIATMKEIGIDISAQTSKALAEFNPKDFDVVISLCGCGVNLPEAWLTREVFQDWQLDDPAEQPEIFPRVRDEIKKRVIQLIASLTTKTTIQSISDNLWWVIPTKLAGVRKPASEEITELTKSGIGAIVSVMDDPSNLALYEQAGISHLWLPTKGGTAPSREQIQELQTFIDQQNRLGKGVAVHCTSGRRRTGTILAAYLIKSGLSYDQAIQTIHEANPDVELREAQTVFLQELAQV
jgi:atypical dual specificity phosphatase